MEVLFFIKKAPSLSPELTVRYYTAILTRFKYAKTTQFPYSIPFVTSACSL